MTNNKGRNIAVVLAGGSGTRFGADRPKQLIEVAGKTIVEHTLDAFEANGNIDEIAIVCKAEIAQQIRDIVARGGYRKVGKVLPGGKERYHSSLAAIEAYTDEDDCLLLHDAVRPMVSQRIIDDCVRAMESYDAVDVAVRTTDTIIGIAPDGTINSIPDRAMLRNVQTPQCFRRRVIRRAYELALADPGFTTTDDCGVVCRYMPEVPVKVVEGDVANIKITYAQDLYLAEKLLGK